MTNSEPLLLGGALHDVLRQVRAGGRRGRASLRHVPVLVQVGLLQQEEALQLLV